MKKNRTTFDEIFKLIETGQDLKFSKRERESPFYLAMKRIYTLGNGDFEIGLQRYRELQSQNRAADVIELQKRHDKIEKHPVSVIFKTMRGSKDSNFRAFEKLIRKDGMGIPLEEMYKLWEEIFNAEIEESTKELLAPAATEQSAGQVDAAKPIKPKQERGAWLETEYSLKRLREIRLEAIDTNRPIPTKAAAMGEAGIDPKTFKKHDKELYAKWDDKSYR